jgi:hypothetical protein
MATAPPPATAERAPLRVRMQQFWRRVTEGMELTQLWSQFSTEARASYRLYSRDVAARTPDDLARRGRRMHIVKEFFWAVLEKLSPARRVLLLAAMILLLSGKRSRSPRGRTRFSFLGRAADVHPADAGDR